MDTHRTTQTESNIRWLIAVGTLGTSRVLERKWHRFTAELAARREADDRRRAVRAERIRRYTALGLPVPV